MRDNKELLKELAENAKGKNIITYKEFSEILPNVKMWFGDTEGKDFLKGQDMVIIGTTNLHPSVYGVYGKEFGIADIGTLAIRKVERNGFHFSYMTYENKDMQEIQFYLVESELIQAAGRARSLREPCTVEIYSNFPLM